jgi:hypothetical protein
VNKVKREMKCSPTRLKTRAVRTCEVDVHVKALVTIPMANFRHKTQRQDSEPILNAAEEKEHIGRLPGCSSFTLFDRLPTQEELRRPTHE